MLRMERMIDIKELFLIYLFVLTANGQVYGADAAVEQLMILFQD